MLLRGISLGVLFILLLMVLAVSLFILGANTENLICQPAKRPSDLEGIFKLADRYLKYTSTNQRIRMNAELKQILTEAPIAEIFK